MGFLNNIISSLKKASRKRVELHKANNSIQFLFDTDDKKYFTLEFDTMQIQNLYDSSTSEAYSIQGENGVLGSLYIEVISLYPQHQWNLSAGSAFDIFLKQVFPKQELRYMDSFENSFCRLSLYQVDYEKELGSIWLSLGSYEVFIIDPKGQLFNDLLNLFEVKNQKLFISSFETTPLTLSKSIVSLNIIEKFFGKGD